MVRWWRVCATYNAYSLTLAYVRASVRARVYPYSIDATHFGGVGRFINHSCDPTCHTMPVLIETHDQQRHRLAIFTLRDVPAGTELTIDYRYASSLSCPEGVRCYCESDNCRGWMLEPLVGAVQATSSTATTTSSTTANDRMVE